MVRWQQKKLIICGLKKFLTRFFCVWRKRHKIKDVTKEKKTKNKKSRRYFCPWNIFFVVLFCFIVRKITKQTQLNECVLFWFDSVRNWCVICMHNKIMICHRTWVFVFLFFCQQSLQIKFGSILLEDTNHLQSGNFNNLKIPVFIGFSYIANVDKRWKAGDSWLRGRGFKPPLRRPFFRHHSFGSKTWSKHWVEINPALLYIL
jgi:hypothetical protein